MKKIVKNLFYLLGTVILAVVLVIGTSFFYLNNRYKDRVIPNVYFYGEKMEDMEYSQVMGAVMRVSNKMKKDITLRYHDKETKVQVGDLGFYWDNQATADTIYNIGKSKNILNKFFILGSSLLNKKEIAFKYRIDTRVMRNYLEELATTIDKDPIDGKFEIQNGRVKDFFVGSDGQKLLISENIDLVKNALLSQRDSVELKVETQRAKSMEDMEKMGVKELFATGASSFAGSPPNRIHNIKVGAGVFNGILIAPGENFSFINYLGEVSAKTGYLPELVIKEDKTIPEYGGGLCQVSTTFFRAAINAGFPIIERSPHAYRVVYYEPAGFDSTIYQPKPDLVFRNDTEHYILVQTRIVGAELFVDFYGTPDGRKVEVSPSTIYNYVQPGEPIITETSELALGEKKQIDSAHIGADAYFTRKIIYSNGEIKEDRFDSHYIPWRAKFLVGKEAGPSQKEPDIDSKGGEEKNESQEEDQS